jgi:hypothetical protein
MSRTRPGLPDHREASLTACPFRGSRTCRTCRSSKSCYQDPSGGDGGGTFAACDVGIAYTAPDGTSGSAELPGVDACRIHGESGQETLVIYFANHSSETLISPQDVIPLWGMILLWTFVAGRSASGAPCACAPRSGVTSGLTRRRPCPHWTGNDLAFSLTECCLYNWGARRVRHTPSRVGGACGSRQPIDMARDPRRLRRGETANRDGGTLAVVSSELHVSAGQRPVPEL